MSEAPRARFWQTIFFRADSSVLEDIVAVIRKLNEEYIQRNDGNPCRLFTYKLEVRDGEEGFLEVSSYDATKFLLLGAQTAEILKTLSK